MKTSLQKPWLDALIAKLHEIDDPDPEIITRDSYDWKLTLIKGTGRIPKLSFQPYGRDTAIKAEIMRRAGFAASEDWKQKKAEIRARYGLKKASEIEDRELARKFNKLSIDYFTKLRAAMLLIADAQKRFCKPDTPLGDPAYLIISDLIPGFQKAGNKTANSQDFRQEKPYNEILAQLD